jgi:prepilin-type N-terminal cleavage/methylation domain-containing protein
MHGGRTSAARATGRGAFTLVEILVVIVIIGILVAIAMTLASRVTQGGRSRLTEDTIRVLDTAVEAWVSAKDQKLPAYWQTDSGLYLPLVDGRWFGRPQTSPPYDVNLDYAQPTIALFLGLASQVPVADAAVKQIDSKLVERRDLQNQVRAWGWAGTSGGTGGGGGNIGLRTFAGVIVKDAFGRPIRMVHPAFDGGHGNFFDSVNQAMVNRPPMTIVPPRVASLPLMNPTAFSRSYKPFDPRTPLEGSPVGDSDEGVCPGGRPYFYSAGPDGDPGTRTDNIYTTRPEPSGEQSKQVE